MILVLTALGKNLTDACFANFLWKRALQPRPPERCHRGNRADGQDRGASGEDSCWMRENSGGFVAIRRSEGRYGAGLPLVIGVSRQVDRIVGVTRSGSTDTRWRNGSHLQKAGIRGPWHFDGLTTMQPSGIGSSGDRTLGCVYHYARPGGETAFRMIPNSIGGTLPGRVLQKYLQVS